MHPTSGRRQLPLKIALAVGSTVVGLLLCNALVWIVSPTEYLYPRYQFSPEYGFLPFPNVVMVNGRPRRFEYRYTTNANSSRGPAVTPGISRLPAIVILGDSNTFGMGVNDGEEYPAVMQNALAGKAVVVSLACPGWGLTQEIRRYYDLGVRYDPRVVVLQFAGNDPDDDLVNRVTEVRDGEFVFVDSRNSLNWIKRYLSRSFLQRTQLYNFFRMRGALFWRHYLVRHEAAPLRSATGDGAPSVPERVYIELLETFATKLHADGRALVLIAADHQLEEHPGIRVAVFGLQDRGLLRYEEVLDWLRGLPNHASPQGHCWGTVAHGVIGEHLAHVVAPLLTLPSKSSDTSS